LIATGDFATAQTGDGVGSLIVAKIVTGDPGTNIATYEVSVACDRGGPRDTFLIKDRDSKVYSNLLVGTSCLVTETRSDGAQVSYADNSADNSADNATDGRVIVKRSNDGCGAPGAPTAAVPGQTNVVTSNRCVASVIITNTYMSTSTSSPPSPPSPPSATVGTTIAVAPAPTTAAPISAPPTSAAPTTAPPTTSVVGTTTQPRRQPVQTKNRVRRRR
jgi:Domain of unknown function (DUF5979)